MSSFSSPPSNTHHFKKGSSCPPLQDGLMRIYSMFYCPFAQRTRIALHLKNVRHETVNINLSEKPDWYFGLNPLGKVPTLQKDDKKMFESMVTCDYLDEAFPEPPLYPSDPWEKGFEKCLVEVFGSKVIGAYYKMYKNPTDAAEIQGIAEQVRAGLDFFEEVLRQRGTPFFFGNKPGMLDVALFPWFERFPVVQKVFPDFEILSKRRFPKLVNYKENMEQNVSVKATISNFDHQVQFLQSVLSGTANYDIGV